MQAVVIHDGRLDAVERPDPVPGDTELLVAVRAAGVNGADLAQSRGAYPAPPGVPADIPGLELAGEVAAIGRRVTRFAVGDRVMALVGGGGQASLATVDETHALPAPAALSWPEAGGFPEVYATAFDALFSQAGLALGERVLVSGASGGVGSAAVQLAAAAGARVTAVVRAAARREAVAALGADSVIDPAEVAGHGPYDVVLELVGGPGLKVALSALAGQGRVLDHRLGWRRRAVARPVRAHGQARAAARLHAALAHAGREGCGARRAAHARAPAAGGRASTRARVRDVSARPAAARLRGLRGPRQARQGRARHLGELWAASRGARISARARRHATPGQPRIGLRRLGSRRPALCASLDGAIIVRKAEQNSRRRRLARQARLFPRQFWLLVGGTFFYLVAIGTAFPYTAILIKGRLDVSMAVVGAIIGGTALAGLPLQPLAGSLSDRFGRRAVMIVCAAFSGVMYGSLAFVHGIVPVCLAVFCDRALGWPLFLTASNAMVADLVRARLRPEGYSLVRLMIGAGEIVGPLIAWALLAAGFGLPAPFLLAGAGCFAFLVFTLVALARERPRVARHVRSTSISEGLPVYGVRDVIRIPSRRRSRRRKTAVAPKVPSRARRPALLRLLRGLAAAAVHLRPDLLDLPGAAHGLPARAPGRLRPAHVVHGARDRRHAVPIVRAIKRLDPMYQVAVASVLFGCGIGLSAFMPAAWPLLVTIARWDWPRRSSGL